MKESVANKHKNCPVVIRYKMFGKTGIATPGLFCKCHDVFLDWLPREVASELIDSGQVQEEPYLRRPKKKNKPKTLA